MRERRERELELVARRRPHGVGAPRRRRRRRRRRGRLRRRGRRRRGGDDASRAPRGAAGAAQLGATRRDGWDEKHSGGARFVQVQLYCKCSCTEARRVERRALRTSALRTGAVVVLAQLDGSGDHALFRHVLHFDAKNVSQERTVSPDRSSEPCNCATFFLSTPPRSTPHRDEVRRHSPLVRHDVLRFDAISLDAAP